MKIVLILGYGPELLVYIRARKIWDFYVSFFPDIEILFFKENPKFGPGEIYFDGLDYNVGIDLSQAPNKEGPTYADTGTWSPNENWRVINRTVAIYHFLLRSRPEPFYCYHATITSVVDLRVLKKLITKLPTQCFAGMPGLIYQPQEYSGLYIWGANAIMSNDLLKILCERYDPLHSSCLLPNDVWQHYQLPEVTRTAIPFFSFLRERDKGFINSEIESTTKKMMGLGYFHFRIKTSSINNENYDRSEIDPWIMLIIIKTILASSTPNNINLIFELIAECMKPLDANNLPMKIPENMFFKTPRVLPLDDNEINY